MSDARLLFQSEQLEAIWLDGPTNRLLIAFAPWNHPADGVGFWAETLARRSGRAALGFVARRANWYPAADMADAAEAVAPVLGQYRRRLTYGGSMGGYAALKFGRLLRADAAIAFAPQHSIDPADGVRTWLYSRHFDPALHAAMRVTAADLCPLNYVVFDPYVPGDRQAFLAVGGLTQPGGQGPRVLPIRAFGAGHGCIQMIAGATRATQFLDACADRQVPAARQMIARWRRSYQPRSDSVIARAAKRHPRWAQALAARQGLVG